MISLDDIRAFVMVAKHESFVAAADELCITPPALSRRIKKLEEFCGDRLFDRTTQMVAITGSGSVLLERAETIIRDFEGFRDFAGRFASENAVKIRFASMWSAAGAIVPKLIRDYARTHPDAEFAVQDASADTVNRLVRERTVDFGISQRPRLDEGLEFAPLCTDPIVLACPPGHREYESDHVEWAQLSVDPLSRIDWGVMRSIDVGTLHEEISGLPINIPDGAPIAHLATQLGFLEAHLTAMVIPMLGACLSRAGEVRCVPIEQPVLTREIGIVTLPKGSLPRSVSAFRDHVVQTFATQYDAAVQRFDREKTQPHVRRL
ncbi:MAG: LysR family transcriptional regulator [Pseudomonadota bacterium]